MSFEALAKNLVQKAKPRNTDRSDADILADLEAAGFARPDVLNGYRELYDTTDDDAIKARILKDIASMHQLMAKPEDTRSTPQIIINIAGDNTRLAAMLNPNLVLVATAERPS